MDDDDVVGLGLSRGVFSFRIHSKIWRSRRMSNAEDRRKSSEQVEDDDEPDEWCVAGERQSRGSSANVLQGQKDLQHWLRRYSRGQCLLQWLRVADKVCR